MNTPQHASFEMPKEDKNLNPLPDRKDKGIKKYIYGALMNVLATGSISGCSNTPETEATQLTATENDEWDLEYETYQRQLDREIKARMSSAKKENPNLTEEQLFFLKMQFESEIRIAAADRRLETRLALLKRSWIKPELQELAKSTEEKIAGMREHVGSNGNVRLVEIPLIEHNMLFADDLSSESLRIEIVLALRTSTEVSEIASIYKWWAFSKKITEEPHTKKIMGEL